MRFEKPLPTKSERKFCVKREVTREKGCKPEMAVAKRVSNMFSIFPTKKFLGCLVTLLLLVAGLKWSTDVCLPGNLKAKLFTSETGGPAVICEPLLTWDIWAHQRASAADSSLNWYNPGASVMINENGSKSYFLFQDDLIKLPILLRRFPNDGYAVVAIVISVLVLALSISMIWHCLSTLVRVSLGINFDRYEHRPRRLTAATRVLGSYVPSNEANQPEQINTSQLKNS